MTDYPVGLAQSIAELATLLVDEEPLEATLDRVLRLATSNIDGVDHGGVSLIREDDKVEATVCRDEQATEIDFVQYTTGIGPCLDAFRNRDVNRIDSTADEQRWRPFSYAAAECGVRSTLSLPLQVRGQAIGALNLYSETEANFDEDHERLGSTFAKQASVALQNALTYQIAYQLTLELNKALVSRAVIDQAKGIIMGSAGVDADRAFELLTLQSQHGNRKLREVAQDLVAQQSHRS